MNDAVQIGHVVEQPPSAVHSRLHSGRIEQHRQIKRSAEHGAHKRNPTQPVLQTPGISAATDRPGTPRNPDHPKAIGEKEKAQPRQGCERFNAALIQGRPLQPLHKLLNPEEKGHQSQGHVVGLLVGAGQMGAVKA